MIFLGLLMLLISLIVWPVFFLFTLLNEIVRLFVTLSLLGTKYKLYSNGQDSTIRSKKFSPSHSYVVPIYSDSDAAICVHKDRELWRTRVFQKKEEDGSLTYAKLMKIHVVKFGYDCVLDASAEFNVDNHVRLYDYVSLLPGRDHFTEDEVTSQLVPALFGTMDSSKPQWEWLIIPKVLRRNGSISSLRLFRTDHGYMDGTSFIKLLTKSLFDWEGGSGPDYVVDYDSIPVPSGFLVTFTKIMSLMILPGIVLLGMLNSTEPNADEPYATNQKYTNERLTFAISDQVEISALKNRKGKNSFNKFLTLTIASVLLEFSKRKNSAIGTEEMKPIRIATTRAMPPFNKYPPQNSVSLSILTAKEKNHEGQCTPEDVILENIGNIEYVVFYIFKWIGRLPLCLFDVLCKPGDTTVAISNVPFTRTYGSIGDVPVSRISSFSNLFLPQGLGITVTSYGGTATICMYSTNEVLDHANLQELVSLLATNIENGSIGDSRV